MKKTVFYHILFLLLPGFGFAQSVLTIQDALKTGLQNNFGILIAKQQNDNAKNDNTLGNAGFLPSLSADGTYQLSDQNVNQLYATGLEQNRNGAITKSLTGGVELDWTVFNGLQMFYNQDKLRDLEKYSQINFQDQVEQSAATIMSAYYQVVMATQQLNVYQEAIRFSLDRLELAKTKYEVGKTSKLEYLQALVDLNSDSSDYVKQLGVINKSKYDLNNSIGIKSGIEYKTMDTIELQPTLDLGSLQSNLSGNYGINEALLNKTIATDNLHITRSNLFPTLGLMARYNVSNVNAQAGFVALNQTQGMVYGLTAKWYLFNGFNTTRLIEDAKMQQNIAQINADAVNLNTSVQLSKAYEDYTSAQNSVKLEKRNLNIAGQNLDIALERYKIGKTDVLEYRQAQVNYTEAHNRLLNAIYSAKIAEIQLYRLTGQMQKIKG